MDIPDEVDLANMKGTGKQAGEEELPEPGGDVPSEFSMSLRYCVGRHFTRAI
jgi:hypothetical protein